MLFTGFSQLQKVLMNLQLPEKGILDCMHDLCIDQYENASGNDTRLQIPCNHAMQALAPIVQYIQPFKHALVLMVTGAYVQIFQASIP